MNSGPPTNRPLSESQAQAEEQRCRDIQHPNSNPNPNPGAGAVSKLPGYPPPRPVSVSA